MALQTRRERYFLYNGLVCLAQGLEGKYTTVDLRNESCVTGRIDQVDGFMNVSMADVVFTDTSGSEFAYDSFFVQARKIRYIHIPNEVAIVPTIKKQLGEIGGHSRKKSQPNLQNTRKGKRLMERQTETLKLVQEFKQDKSTIKQDQKADEDKS